MKTITLCSFKGGTSKTSTSLHLGACLALFHEKKVLLVDFDPQANLSTGLGVGPDSLDSIVPVIEGQRKISDVIQTTSVKGLDIVPSNAFLDGIERTPELSNDLYAHEKLRKSLLSVKDNYDFCFIDTPPSLGWLTQSAYFASDHSLICVIPEVYSVLALRRLKEFHEMVNQHHAISVFGVILSFWNDRGAINEEFLAEINDSFPDLLFDSKIRRDIAISRAVLQGKPVMQADPQSRASEDYEALTVEFLKNLSKESKKREVAHV